ncbi:hypothetical protein, partial [Escherichia coli]|uniref:hypothetical protein n=1 Tax=Escherichia coli TaxID=562 RepID=UPI002283F4CE
RQRLTRLIHHPPATRARALSTFFVGHIQRLLSAARFPWFFCPAGAVTNCLEIHGLVYHVYGNITLKLFRSLFF